MRFPHNTLLTSTPRELSDGKTKRAELFTSKISFTCPRVLIDNVLEVDNALALVAHLEVDQALFELGRCRLVRGRVVLQNLGERGQRLFGLLLSVVTLTDPIERVVGQLGVGPAPHVFSEAFGGEVIIPSHVILVG